MMAVEVEERDSPAVTAILRDGGLPVRFDPAHADVLIVGYEERVPVCFAAGFVWEDQPILHQVAVRPGFVQVGRLRTLVDAYMAEMIQRGFEYVLIPVDGRHPLARHHRVLLESWPAVPYHRDGPWEWYVHYARDPDE